MTFSPVPTPVTHITPGEPFLVRRIGPSGRLTYFTHIKHRPKKSPLPRWSEDPLLARAFYQIDSHDYRQLLTNLRDNHLHDYALVPLDQAEPGGKIPRATDRTLPSDSRISDEIAESQRRHRAEDHRRGAHLSRGPETEGDRLVRRPGEVLLHLVPIAAVEATGSPSGDLGLGEGSVVRVPRDPDPLQRPTPEGHPEREDPEVMKYWIVLVVGVVITVEKVDVYTKIHTGFYPDRLVAANEAKKVFKEVYPHAPVDRCDVFYIPRETLLDGLHSTPSTL